MKQNIIKFKSLAFGICATCMVLVTGCSESEYAKINTDPSTIAEGNPVFLFTQEQVQYQPFDYLLWYYDGAYTSKIVQAYSPSSSFNDLYNKLALNLFMLNDTRTILKLLSIRCQLTKLLNTHTFRLWQTL